jgi:hypothetical protein
MLIISFDIGIKNLAYCVFLLPNFSVVKWGIANLMPPEPDVNKTCCSKCTKPASYTHNSQYYCKVHAKKTGGILATDVPKYRTLNKSEIVKLLVLHAIPHNAGGVKPELVEAADAYYKQRVINPVEKTKKTGANQVHLVTIGTNIKTQMDTVLQGLPPIDTVLLENQISPIAGRMNTIQGMLAQYFVMRGCNKIEFIASSGKLKDMKAISGTEYKNHKEDGIKFCKMFLQANATTLGHLEESVLSCAAKKDDLADCFLQGVYYLKRENIILYSENLEIKLVC